ncbi:MFS transporter [Acrocarpospora phusangensis]|uniref:MFS transporter n=1 Tax=Acrocarpospora phusangensis TaxID=1070424 RepID=A0A919UJQ1_9ACTN|nr:DHA2 family efflux MFS transporter permease subunit [Acrocarpospora phusangensis]GIH24259.1 MFS transporter [Acrocarpospora phusangensis]
MPVTNTRKWGTLVISCLAMLLLALDLTVLHQAMPKLMEDLAPSATQLLWILDIYGFALAGLLITMGNLGDRIGRKRLLLIGTAAFGAASALTAYAPTPELLIAARALLGVAGATVMPSTLSIIRNVFTDPKERTAAVGIWSSISALGFAGGPVVGGLLLDHFWWGSVFLINVPITALLLIGGWLLLPESRNPRSRPIDLISVPLSFAGVIGLVYAMKVAAHDGLGERAVWISAAIGVLSLVVFVRRQTRLAEPLIDVRLFRHRAFTGSIGANVIILFAMLAMSVAFAQYFQLIRGWSPLVAGLAGLPGGFSAAIGGGLAGVLVSAIGRAKVVTLGLLLTGGGLFLYSLIELDTPYLLMLPAMMISGVGMGFTFAVTNDTILAAVPRERAGAASAISETATEVGGSLGIAVLGSVIGGLYSQRLTPPPGLPAGVAEAAGESLGGAFKVAATLPPDLAEALVGAAQRTYIDSMQVSALTGACLLAVLSLTVLYALRGVPKEIPEVVLDDEGQVDEPARTG